MPQLLQRRERVAPNTPTFHVIAEAREGVHDRVKIRRDVKAVQDEIVGRVADDGQLFRIELVAEALNEFGAAGAPGQSYEHKRKPQPAG